MNKRSLTQLAALALLSSALTTATAAALTAQEALAHLTSSARIKTTQDHLAQIFSADQAEFIVEFKDETPQQADSDPLTLSGTLAARKQAFQGTKSRVLSRFAGASLEIRKDYSHLPLAYVRAKNRAALATLLEASEVVAIYANKRHTTTLAQSLSQIGQPPVATAGRTGAGTAVVVLDTGLNYTLPDFGNCTAPGVPATTCRVPFVQDFAPQDNSLDANGHGTNVAAIVAGVAPGTKVIGLDVFNGASAWSTDILAGVNWAIANRVTHNIVSMNLSLSDSSTNATECPSTWAQSTFAQARAAGIVPVVASGNSGYNGGISAPSCAPAAVAVGAVYDANLGGLQWFVTPTTTCTDSITALDKVTCFSNSGAALDLLAPGSAITAGGMTMSGTSQAAPHVAGAIAVLRSRNVTPYATADQAIQKLISTGVSIADPKNALVRPRINLQAAVNASIGVLANGQVLTPGQAVTSANARFRFVYQNDGNLVVYDGGTPRWASNTAGQPGASVRMQGDGNLVMYAANGQPLWNSGTWQHAGSRLVVQNNGNVVILRPDGVQVWATNTTQP